MDNAAAVDTNACGTYTITYTATDAAGNRAITNRTVLVQDTTPPTIAAAGTVPILQSKILLSASRRR